MGIRAIDAEMIELCRQFHAYPELSLKECCRWSAMADVSFLRTRNEQDG
jgi:metal-dependent amidase/aminoacylase/carboxypeptidase family protein